MKKYKARYKPDGVLTILEAGLRLNISVSTVRAMIKDGRLLAVIPEGSRKQYVITASVEALERKRRAEFLAAIGKKEATEMTVAQDKTVTADE